MTHQWMIWSEHACRSWMLHLCVSVSLMSSCWLSPIWADEPTCHQVALYEGIDLSTGRTEVIPDVLTVLLNPSDRLRRAFSPAPDTELFVFSAGVDLYFGYDPDATQPIRLTPQHLQASAMLRNMPLETVTTATLTQLDWITPPVAVNIGAEDTIVVRMPTGDVMAVGHVTRQPDWTIRFETQIMSPTGLPTPLPTHPPSTIPEPATLVLMGLGVVLILGAVKRTHPNHTSRGGHGMKLWNLLLLSCMSLVVLTGSATAATVTVTKQGPGDGTVQSDGIDCGSDCTEVYPDESLVFLKATPNADSLFKGWLVDGQPQQGALVIKNDMTVTAIFDRKMNLSDIQFIIDDQGVTVIFPSGIQRRFERGDDVLWWDVSPHGQYVAVLQTHFSMECFCQLPSTVFIYNRAGEERGVFEVIPFDQVIIADDGRFVVYGEGPQVDTSAFVFYMADGREVKRVAQGAAWFGNEFGIRFAPFDGLLVLRVRNQGASSVELFIFDSAYTQIGYQFFEYGGVLDESWFFFDETQQYILFCRCPTADIATLASSELLTMDAQGNILSRKEGCQ